MFSMRKNLAGNRHWNRPFITALGTDLSESGFKEITVKLPIDLDALLEGKGGIKNQIDNELRKREISLQEFLDRERNYPAIILVGFNPITQETIKVLFVNLSMKTAFMDDTFPSGHSIPSQLYVQSPDAARVYSLFHFFYDHLNQGGESTATIASLGLVAVLILAAQVISFVRIGKGLLQIAWGFTPLLDIGVTILLLFVQYRFFRVPTGLSVNDRKTATTASFIQRALRGEFKDNPVVNIIVTVLASILSAIVLRLIGWP
jgi:hypothetical protein